MPQQPIPFAPKMEPDTDPLMGAAPVAVNAVYDGAGFRRRMGLGSYTAAPSAAIASTAISGLHLTAGGILLAVDSAIPNRNIYAVTAGGAQSLSQADGSGGLRGTSRPVFAETEAIVAIAGGAEPQKVDLTLTPVVSTRLGGSPPGCSHIIANNSRLLTNNTSVKNRINYSDQAAGSSYAGHEVWSGGTSGYIASDARADYVVGLGDNANEVFGFGRKTTQAFAADSTVTYASVSARDFGCSAPNSILRLENGFGWLDHKRRIIISDGRAFDPISHPIQFEFDGMVDTEDTYSFTPYTDMLAWRFADGRTFVYDTRMASWSLWMGFDSVTNAYEQWLGSAALIRDDNGQCLIGTTTGKIRRLAYGNADDDGDPIVMTLTTGFLGRGTSARKWCKRVWFMFRRGEAGADSKALVSWRDGASAPWGTPRELFLSGTPGDFSVGVDLQGLGVYRMRQWRLTYSGPDDIVFAGAIEDFELTEV